MKDDDFENFDPELRKSFEFAGQQVDESLINHHKALKMHSESLKVSGDYAFYTIQGEGPTLGYPAVFLRLHVCNLRCTWCDAWYTWNPNTEEFWTEPRDVELEDVAKKVNATWACIDSNVQKRVVITGGEPLIQKRQLDELILALEDWQIEIETNGTLMPTQLQLIHCQFNCSPKLQNSENRKHARIKPEILKALNRANTTFKFVATNRSDITEIEEDYLQYVDKEKVVIMPEGITEEEISFHAKELIEVCKERGFRMTPRFQAIFAHGAKRGV